MDQSQLKWVDDFIWNIADDHNKFRARLEAAMKAHGKKLGDPEKKTIDKAVSWRDEADNDLRDTELVPLKEAGGILWLEQQTESLLHKIAGCAA